MANKITTKIIFSEHGTLTPQMFADPQQLGRNTIKLLNEKGADGLSKYFVETYRVPTPPKTPGGEPGSNWVTIYALLSDSQQNIRKKLLADTQHQSRVKQILADREKSGAPKSPKSGDSERKNKSQKRAARRRRYRENRKQRKAAEKATEGAAAPGTPSPTSDRQSQDVEGAPQENSLA